MFNYNHRHAVALRMFVTILAANIAKVNELITKHFSEPKNVRVVLFGFAGVVVTVIRNSNKLFLNIMVGEKVVHQFALNHIKQPVSKRLVNDIEVFFHREYREQHAGAISKLDDAIDLADVKHKARNIPLVCRLFYKPVEFDIEFNDRLLSEIFGAHVTIRRSIFNKLSVTVVTGTKVVSGLMREVFPVHVGVSRNYLADGSSDPVNQWFRQCLTDHVDTFFK